MKEIIYILTAIYFIIALMVPIWMAKKYPISGTPLKVRIIVFLTFFILAIYAAMLPIDIYNGMNDDDYIFSSTVAETQTLGYTIMVYQWKSFYGFLLLMSYFIIPYMRIELESGITDDDERRKKSIWTIVLLYSVLGSISLVMLIYLLISGHLQVTEIKQFIIA